MQEREVMDIFSRTGAFRQGHFKLSSGLHSAAYLQCALVLQQPVIAERLCKSLAQKFSMKTPDVVVGPAMGGILLAYELARHLNARAVFTERDDNGKMTLRRGFSILPSNKVLIAEDVLTTGRSVREVMDLLQKDSISPVGIAGLVDRSKEDLDFGGTKKESLLKLDIPVFEEKDCPLCKEGVALRKPGSRTQ